MQTNKKLGILIVIQSLLIFVPMYILGTAINWPDSLNYPADRLLPLIYGQASAVNIGYFVYFLYSILFFFTGTLLAWELKKTATNQARLHVAAIAAGLSSLARVVGIIRWLVPFPILATQYATTVDPNLQMIQETVYTVVNNYGGAIGELLGVTIFASIWTILISWEFIVQKNLPTWLGYFGLLAALVSLSMFLEVFGLTVSGFLSQSLFHVWLLGVGMYFMVKKSPQT
jgi:hypothetical protein